MLVTHSSDKIQSAKSLIERLFYHAEINPAHDAVVTPSLKLSYAQLIQLVQVQVKKLYEAGISSQSVVGIKCENDTQHLVLCLATTYIGTASCTIPSHESEQIHNAIISCCGVTDVIDEGIAVDLVTSDRDIESIPTQLPTARLLFSTSGTTGDPKIVVHHDIDLVAQAHRHISSSDERFACLASMEHNFAKRHRLYCVAVGATNAFLDTDSDSLVAQCQYLNVNVMHVSAFQAQDLLATTNIGELSHIRLKLGGSHVHVSLRQQLRDGITKNLQAGYGTTETGAIAFTDPNHLDDVESVGQPLPGINIRIVSQDGKTLDQGKQGDIAVHCNGMFREYLGKPDLTADRVKDGWFYTGDIGYLDEQQRIHLCGRSDDMFVFNSMNIYPQEIESQICQFPSITDAAVLPKSSSIHGHIPVALVVFEKNTKPDLPALKKFMKSEIGIRMPRQLIIVDEIPRNTSGKISRREVMNLSESSTNIREAIIQALGEHATDHLKPSLISSLIKGDTDIKLRKFKMDSLSRMEFLIELEMSYNVVITPQEFSQFRYFGNLVARVLSRQSEGEPEQVFSPKIFQESGDVSITNSKSYVVVFFQRIFSFCHTVTQLNKALSTLENRLTPTQIEELNEWNSVCQLIPSCAAQKYHTALRNWLKKIKDMMMGSGKVKPESFVSHRVSPHVRFFTGSGSIANKSLLICFSEAGSRNLGIPNAVFLQYMDSLRYDLLIISEPLNEKYRLGVPHIGSNITEVIEWIAKLDFIKNYSRIRTLGCSAGGYPAIIAGYYLGAELAVSVGGRFYRKSHTIKSFERIFATWRATQKRNCSCVLMSYAKEELRDHFYAKIISKLSSGKLMAVEFADGKVEHLFVRQLLERGELTQYLTRTIFADMNDEIIAGHRANVILSYPEDKIRPNG